MATLVNQKRPARNSNAATSRPLQRIDIMIDSSFPPAAQAWSFASRVTHWSVGRRVLLASGNELLVSTTGRAIYQQL